MKDDEKLMHELRKACKGQRHLMKRIRKLQRQVDRLQRIVDTYEPTAVYKVIDAQRICLIKFREPLTEQQVNDFVEQMENGGMTGKAARLRWDGSEFHRDVVDVAW